MSPKQGRRGDAEGPGKTRQQVGMRIREIRVRRGLVIDALAKKTGLSRPYISQVETGKASPSLHTIERIARALDVPITHLFVEDAFACHVIRKDQRQVVSFGAPDKLVHFLSAPHRSLEMVLLEIPVGYTAGGRSHAHEGEECHLVLSGTIRAVQGDRVFVLEEGDSFHWDGSLPHRVENAGQVPARLLVARTPPGFLSVTFTEASRGRAP